jgi:ABC-2 type transport system ATP-binding protein
MDEVVSVEQINKKLGKGQILDDVSFTAQKGTQTAVIGMNGSGKTTLMRILAGCLKPDSGRIFYFGKDMTGGMVRFADLCGYLPQENPLMQGLSVGDNLSLWSGERNCSDGELIDIFELRDIMKTPVNRLSGGMQRRISIACAAVNRPPILILDEPSTSLDSCCRESIHKFLKAYRNGGGTVIISTHDEEEIRQSSSCFIIENGRVREK